jgi:hypothetical protein
VIGAGSIQGLRKAGRPGTSSASETPTFASKAHDTSMMASATSASTGRPACHVHLIMNQLRNKGRVIVFDQIKGGSPWCLRAFTRPRRIYRLSHCAIASPSY